MPDRPDPSRGYDAVADAFVRARDPRIGAALVARWAQALPAGGSVLDVGCGHGVPVSRTLLDAGLEVFGVDASPALVAAFRVACPGATVACEAAERSALFGRTFDGAVAVGLLFLLEPEAQAEVIRRAAGALRPGGRFLCTAPETAGAWTDRLTGRPSVSLGIAAYGRLLAEAGLDVVETLVDEGGNHHVHARRARPAG